MATFNIKRLMRRVVAILLMLVGGLGGLVAITYIPALAHPSFATFRVVAVLAVPMLLIVGGVGLFFGKPWSRVWLLTALVVNLVAGFSFVPYLALLTGRLMPIPFAEFAAKHVANFAVIAVAWLLQGEGTKISTATPESPHAEKQDTPFLTTLAKTVRWASLAILALVVVAWPMSAFRPIHFAGILTNRSFLAFYADILDIADNRVWLRTYQSAYWDGEAFYIEAMCGGMPFSTDNRHFTPLEHDWRLFGVRLGYDYETLPYRCDVAVDIVMPMWLLTVLALPAPLVWLWKRRRVS
jgi:hypothetical protein